MAEAEMNDLTEDILGDFGFRCVWKSAGHYVDLDVYEIVARGKNGRPCFEGEDGFVDEPKRLYLKAYIKWDACSHFNFGNGAGYIHICGPEKYRDHIALMNYILTKAPELMGRTDSRDWK